MGSEHAMLGWHIRAVEVRLPAAAALSLSLSTPLAT